jgi:hypothetical protein
MDVDVVLWFIFAAIAALLYCGCIYTAPRQKPLRRDDGPIEGTADRTA